jgi:uncharacterized protein (TIGR02284 family)
MFSIEFKNILMNNQSELADILVELVGMHENRIHEYEEIEPKIEEADRDLQQIIRDKVKESGLFISELCAGIAEITGKTPDQPFDSGLRRWWMDIRKVFTGHGRKSLLGYFECVEHALSKAYLHALESEATMEPIEIRKMIQHHYELLKASYEAMRENHDHPSLLL